MQQQLQNKGSRRVNLRAAWSTYGPRLFTCVLPLVPMGIIIWALVHYRQGRQLDRAICHERDLQEGFRSNADFYGLGIRIGIYLQWFAIALAHIFLPSASLSLTGSFIATSMAMMIALMLLAFSNGCIYTAEVVVILYLLFGGFYATTSMLVPNNPMEKNFWSKMRDLDIGLQLVAIIIIPVSTWFWVRMATAGEADFFRAHGSTSIFFFGQVTGRGLHIASCVLAVISVWMFATPIFALPAAEFGRLAMGNCRSSSLYSHGIFIYF